MKVTVYVDWNNQQIINEKEKAKWIDNELESREGDEGEFECFLECATNLHDLYFMNEIEKQKLWSHFSEEQKAEAVLEFNRRFRKMEIEV